jgi:hypothetical protein
VHAAAEEEKHEEEKSNLSRGERIAMALGRPFTKKDPTVCELHLVVRLQAIYHTATSAGSSAQ